MHPWKIKILASDHISLVKCCPDCASIVKLNSKHKRMQRIESCKEAVKVAKKLY